MMSRAARIAAASDNCQLAGMLLVGVTGHLAALARQAQGKGAGRALCVLAAARESTQAAEAVTSACRTPR